MSVCFQFSHSLFLSRAVLTDTWAYVTVQPVGFVPVAVGKSAEDLVPRGMFRKIHLHICFIIRHTLLLTPKNFIFAKMTLKVPIIFFYISLSCSYCKYGSCR